MAVQKKVVFVAEDGSRYEPTAALGPASQILTVRRDKESGGHFDVYAEDVSTLLATNIPAKLVSGRSTC